MRKLNVCTGVFFTYSLISKSSIFICWWNVSNFYTTVAILSYAFTCSSLCSDIPTVGIFLRSYTHIVFGKTKMRTVNENQTSKCELSDIFILWSFKIWIDYNWLQTISKLPTYSVMCYKTKLKFQKLQWLRMTKFIFKPFKFYSKSTLKETMS